MSRGVWNGNEMIVYISCLNYRVKLSLFCLASWLGQKVCTWLEDTVRDKREISLEFYIRSTEVFVFRNCEWQSFLLKAVITLLILSLFTILLFFYHIWYILYDIVIWHYTVLIYCLCVKWLFLFRCFLTIFKMCLKSLI